jgi:hypothetical protein
MLYNELRQLAGRWEFVLYRSFSALPATLLSNKVLSRQCYSWLETNAVWEQCRVLTLSFKLRSYLRVYLDWNAEQIYTLKTRESAPHDFEVFDTSTTPKYQE